MNENNNGILGWIIGIVIVILIFTMMPFTIIEAGERGVVLKLGQVQENVLGEGFHFITLFVDSVEKVSVRVQKTEVNAEAASKDLQTVNTDIAINWHLNPAKVNKIFQTVGNLESVSSTIIAPAVQEAVKVATAQKTASEVISERAMLKQDIDTSLSKRLSGYNIIVDAVSITNVDFSKDFNDAINDKTVAIQKAQKAENDLARIKFEAEQTIVTAKANAESMKIQTEALSQNSALIELKKAEALLESAKKGVKIVPDTILGAGGSYLINVK